MSEALDLIHDALDVFSGKTNPLKEYEMNEMKATVYLTVELGRMMKIHYMRNSKLPELDYVLKYFYTPAGENIDKEEYPKDFAAEVYENLVVLKHEGKEIW